MYILSVQDRVDLLTEEQIKETVACFDRGLYNDVVACLKDDNLIAAIKIVRDRYHLDLRFEEFRNRKDKGE